MEIATNPKNAQIPATTLPNTKNPTNIIPPINKSIGKTINNSVFFNDLNKTSLLRFSSILSFFLYFLSRRSRGQNKKKTP